MPHVLLRTQADQLSILGRPLLRASSSRPWLATRSRNFHDLGRSLPTSATSRKDGEEGIRKEIRHRKAQIDESGIEVYPRYVKHKEEMSLVHFTRKWHDLKAGDVAKPEEAVQTPVEVTGRIKSIRSSGQRLAFISIVGGQGHKLQVLYSFGPLERQGISRPEFARIKQLLHRGDVISIKGYPHRTSSGELSIKAVELPQMLAPCLHDFPAERTLRKSSSEQEHEAQKLDKHVDMLLNPEPIQVMVQRYQILNNLRKFFTHRQYIEVQTPILAAAAGGATARPFETTATEFPEKTLALRVAPELWLKRLIIGGLPKVFEIGPSFRNEGLDKTHNPEFTTCETYSAFTSLPELISTTEELFFELSTKQNESLYDKINRHGTFSLKGRDGNAQEEPYPPSSLKGPYPQIDFIPALNAALSQPLPNLSHPAPEVLSTLLSLFTTHSIPLPEKPTLPRLLDKLSSHFLEPQCKNPTWITNLPACMSPLSKSSIHPTAPNDQPVAARAELFINHLEIVNCYEEENDPFEQRRKFKLQGILASTFAGDSGPQEPDPEAMPPDEDYLRALEWGLPPTGGWGCGIDRLVMMLTGKERIGDVLAFGSFRAVTRTAEKWKGENVKELGSSEEVERMLAEEIKVEQ
jgi:lysyl-tRNA synthetase class 2